MNIVTWITNALSMITKFGPVLGWVLKLFPQMGFATKLLAILDKMEKDPKYPFLDVLKDVADLFSDAVTPQPMPPGVGGTVGAPDYYEVFSANESASAYHALPDNVKQLVIDKCNSINPDEVGAIPWPAVTTIWTLFGPFAQKILELFISSWLIKRTKAIMGIKARIAAAAPPTAKP